MEKNNISPFCVTCIYVLFMLSGVQVLNLFESGRSDLWISVIVSVFFSLPTLLICLRLCSIYPGENLFAVIFKSCGGFFGTAFSVVYVVYGIFVAATTLRFISEFIHTVSFPNTPQLVTVSVFGYLCCRALKYGKEVFSKFCFCLFFIIISVLLLIAVLSAGLYDVSNFRPVLLGDIPQIIDVGLGVSSFSFGETILLIGFIGSVRASNGSLGLVKRNMKRVVLWGCFVGTVLIMGIMASNVLILGEETMKRLYFPYYTAVSLIDIGDFLTHIEVIAVIVFVLSLTVKTGVALSVTVEGIAKLFKLSDLGKLLFPLAFLIAATALDLFDNVSEMSVITQVNKYIGAVLQLFIPLIILVCAEIKMRRSHKMRL